MSTTREIDYKGKKIKVTVANTGRGMYVGTFLVPDTDPLIRGEGGDANTEEVAFDNAARRAKEAVDQRG